MMNNPFPRSTNVLDGFFYKNVIVTKADVSSIVQANTGTDDQTLTFETELTNALGKLAILLVKNPQPTKKQDAYILSLSN